jgi:hypothetical protein
VFGLFLTPLGDLGLRTFNVSNVLPTEINAYYFLAPVLVLVWVLVGAFARWRRGSAALNQPLWVMVPFAAVFAPIVILHSIPLLLEIPLAPDAKAIGATGDLLIAPATADKIFPTPAPPNWRHSNGTVSFIATNLVLTILLSLAVIAGRTRRGARTSSTAVAWLLVLIVVSTATTLAPTGWAGEFWFYMAFVFPVVYQFAVDARHLNSRRSVAAGTALGLLGGALALVAISTYRLTTGRLSGDAVQGTDLYLRSRSNIRQPYPPARRRDNMLDALPGVASCD